MQARSGTGVHARISEEDGGRANHQGKPTGWKLQRITAEAQRAQRSLFYSSLCSLCSLCSLWLKPELGDFKPVGALECVRISSVTRRSGHGCGIRAKASW